MKMLRKEQVLALHGQLISATWGSPLLRDAGMLESALSAPFQSYAGAEAYSTLLEKAARLCYGLVKNHPFVDGNKRIGIHTALVFLAVNGVELAYTQAELAQVILSLAAGETGYEALLDWMISHEQKSC